MSFFASGTFGYEVKEYLKMATDIAPI